MMNYNNSGKIWRTIYFMTVQNFAFGELNMCSKLWCNHWLSCRNRRLNCYMLTRLKLDNCFHAWLTCLQRNWCALASNTSAANERWPIQTTHTVTYKCCGFFQYTPAANHACHTLSYCPHVRSSSDNRYNRTANSVQIGWNVVKN